MPNVADSANGENTWRNLPLRDVKPNPLPSVQGEIMNMQLSTLKACKSAGGANWQGNAWTPCDGTPADQTSSPQTLASTACRNKTQRR